MKYFMHLTIGYLLSSCRQYWVMDWTATCLPSSLSQSKMAEKHQNSSRTLHGLCVTSLSYPLVRWVPLNLARIILEVLSWVCVYGYFETNVIWLVGSGFVFIDFSSLRCHGCIVMYVLVNDIPEKTLWIKAGWIDMFVFIFMVSFNGKVLT